MKENQTKTKQNRTNQNQQSFEKIIECENAKEYVK